MNCPYCGNPLEEGKVFCEACGKEIQIVPVFEPEIEDRIQKSLKHVVELLEHPEGDAGSALSQDEISKKIRKRKLLLLGCVIGAFVLILCAAFSFRNVSRYNNYDYQMQMAGSYYDNGDSEGAFRYALRATQIAPNSSDAKMMLANCYNNNGEEKEAEKILEELVETDSSYTSAYKLLIMLYEEEAAYQKISDLLQSCNNTTIVEQYQEYAAFSPELSEEEGHYDSVLSLKILAGSNGDVYYTLDGTVPDTSSSLYLGPIRLEGGTYEVRAIYINHYGIASAVTAGTYVVDIATPDEPEISVESGTYHSPQMIETFLGEDFEIYYTTDGSDPTRNSNPYLSPIPMPLGHSVFKFIMYNDEGVASHIAVREFDLQLSTHLSTDAALIILKQALIRSGSIMDMQGHVMGETSYKDYELKSAFTENDQIFYLITEYLVELDRTRSKTGNQYAVNIATNELYRASSNYAGYYVVEPFE